MIMVMLALAADDYLSLMKIFRLIMVMVACLQCVLNRLFLTWMLVRFGLADVRIVSVRCFV